MQTSSNLDQNGKKAYRFGYQGSEKDFEITNVTGTHVTTYFREIDTRLGIMWSVDPRASAFESPCNLHE